MRLAEPDVGLTVRGLEPQRVRGHRIGQLRLRVRRGRDRHARLGRAVAVFVDFAVVDDERMTGDAAMMARRSGEPRHRCPNPGRQLLDGDVPLLHEYQLLGHVPHEHIGMAERLLTSRQPAAADVRPARDDSRCVSRARSSRWTAVRPLPVPAPK